MHDSHVAIDRTIIASNRGSALTCVESHLTVTCLDLYGHAGRDELCGTNLGGSFSADPLFRDAEERDCALDGCSPCLPGNPCSAETPSGLW